MLLNFCSVFHVATSRLNDELNFRIDKNIAFVQYLYWLIMISVFLKAGIVIS